VVLIPNIGRRERRKPLVMGAVAFLAALVLAVALPLRWRIPGVFIPMWLAALGFFQARDKT
jgi:hypothetical protein